MPVLFDYGKTEKPIIKVIGVGGGGSNAVNHMFNQGIVGVDFAICNTDNQALEASEVPLKIQLGTDLTGGLGAGAKPQVGKAACIETIDEIKKYLADNTKMLFITAGMGGGTGTGAAPIIAKAAKEMDILTVAIVTIPFAFEGKKRHSFANEGIEELKKNVDSLIIISNEKLRSIHGNLSLSEAFAQADNILTTAAKGIAEIITVPGYVNVDFEDVYNVMKDSGVALMGIAKMEGENRARRAIETALTSPLLEDNNIQGAQHILFNITSGTKEVTMDEVEEITEFIRQEAGYGTDIIFGHSPNDDTIGEALMVTVIATAFEHKLDARSSNAKPTIKVPLDQPETSLEDVQQEDDDIDTQESAPNVFIFEGPGNDVPTRRNFQQSSDPFIVDEDDIEDTVEYKEAERERIQRLRKKMKKFNRQNINEWENVPAYKRREVVLEEATSDQYSKASRLTIDEDGELEMNDELNSFLHKEVD